MAIGGTRKLAELVEGDEIYGTVREGHYRRYAKTRVPVGVIRLTGENRVEEAEWLKQ